METAAANLHLNSLDASKDALKFINKLLSESRDLCLTALLSLPNQKQTPKPKRFKLS